MNEIVVLIYAHTEYMDILVPSLRSQKKYFPDMKWALCIDSKTELLQKYGNEFEFKYIHEFKPDEHVYARVTPLLEMIEEPYIIFNIEINVLVDYVDKNILFQILKQVKEQDIHQVKLLVAGVLAPHNDIQEIFKDESKNLVLYPVTSGYFLSLNTSLWKRESFLELAKQFPTHPWRCSECGDIQRFVQSHFKTYAHATRNDQVIMFADWEHYYNAAFPFVHTTAAGKWRLTGKYQKALVKKFWDEWGVNVKYRENFETENHIF
jgi:hypothetical protein